jgi:DNA-binding beta-propeller fold protein YncE
MKSAYLAAYCLGVAATCVAGTAWGQDSPEPARWAVEVIMETGGFAVPECVLPDKPRNQVFVSNIDAAPDHYWDDDEKGFISLLSPEGEVIAMRWLDSTPEAVLHSPKGMCVLGDKLYFTDNALLKRCDVASPGKVETIPLPKSARLNDLATDGESVYVSDSALSLIYRVAPDGSHKAIPSPESPNGVTCHEGNLYAVSWDLHEVYALDPEGVEAPKPFGLAEHFTNLDGIEVLEDGTLIVSDFMGNKISAITPDHKTVYTLVELETPADIGIDRERGLLYVPQFMIDQVAVLRLVRR